MSKHSPLYKSNIIILLILILSIASPIIANSGIMQEGNNFYINRHQPGKAQAAADIYDQALKSDSKNYEAAWRRAQALYWVGNHTIETNQNEIFEKAVEAAKQAVIIDPQGLAGHYWLGVCYAVYGKAKGIIKSISLIEPIKEEMNFIIKSDPSYEDGGAYRVLGRLYFKLPSLMGGSNEKAIENLKLAISYGPQRWLNHLYLAEIYITIGKKAEAKNLLNQVINAQPQPGLEPEFTDWKIEAEKLLNLINL